MTNPPPADWKLAILVGFLKPAITLHIADAWKVKKLPMARKKAKTIRKTETGIWPGHMLKRRTMPSDAARKPKNFFNVKWPKANGFWLQKLWPTN